MNIKILNTWYFVRILLLSQLLYIYPALIMLIDLACSIFIVLIFDFIIMYLLSILFIKTVQILDGKLVIIQVAKLFKRKQIIEFINIARISHKNSRTAGDINEFWLYLKNRRLPILFTYSGNIDEIKKIINCFENNGVIVKSSVSLI